MSRPYIPVLVEGIVGLGPGLASAIGLVAGTAALVGVLVSPLGGVIGDRIGFRPVLITALSGAGIVLFLMPLAASIGMLAVLAVGLGAAGTATVSSMVFGLLATELPPERRSAALNPAVPAALRGRDHRPRCRRGGRLAQWRERAVRRGCLHLHIRGTDDRAATRSHRRAATGRQRAARDEEHTGTVDGG